MKKIDRMTPSLDKIQKQLDNLPREAFNFWVSVTPIDKGGARRKTKLRGMTIVADYPYAQRLNEGWSKQAPDGMAKPTEEFLEQRMKEILRK